MEQAHLDGQAAWAEALSSDAGQIRAVEQANCDGRAALAEALSREPPRSAARPRRKRRSTTPELQSELEKLEVRAAGARQVFKG